MIPAPAVQGRNTKNVAESKDTLMQCFYSKQKRAYTFLYICIFAVFSSPPCNLSAFAWPSLVPLFASIYKKVKGMHFFSHTPAVSYSGFLLFTGLSMSQPLECLCWLYIYLFIGACLGLWLHGTGGFLTGREYSSSHPSGSCLNIFAATH